MNTASSATPAMPALSAGFAAGHRERFPGQAILTVLGLVLTLWNAFLFVAMVSLMPKNDFGRTLWSAIAFLRGETMYGPNEATYWKLGDNTAIHLWNLNPPHFHLFLLPLAVLPQGVALLIWCLLGGLCLYLSVRIIHREIGLELTPGRRGWVVLSLSASTAMGAALFTAHMSFPLMLLIVVAWRDARRGLWSRAGALLGLGMSIKPFLLIFVPFLLLRRCWRGVTAAGITCGFSFLLGLTVFGVDNHRSWLKGLSVADSWAWLPMNASLFGFLSRAFTENPLFAPLARLDSTQVRSIWLCLGIPAGLLALFVSLADSSRRGTDRAFSLLLVSSLLCSPLGWTYYFWLPLGPIAALAAGWWRDHTGLIGDVEPASLPWRRQLMLAAAPGLFSPSFVTLTGQPLPMASLLAGGIYFWCLLLVWLALIVDGLFTRRVLAEALPPSHFLLWWRPRSPRRPADSGES